MFITRRSPPDLVHLQLLKINLSAPRSLSQNTPQSLWFLSDADLVHHPLSLRAERSNLAVRNRLKTRLPRRYAPRNDICKEAIDALHYVPLETRSFLSYYKSISQTFSINSLYMSRRIRRMNADGNFSGFIRDNMTRMSYYIISAFIACNFFLYPCTVYSGVNDELLAAASEGNFAGVKDLVSQGADVNTKDNFSKSPLTYAASKGHEMIVDFLVGKGADVNAQDDSGWTPLHHAASNGHTETAKILIGQVANINKRELSGKTVLFYAVRSGNIQIVKDLIDKGADINAKDRIGFTPLMEACECGRTAIAKILIENGADVDAKQVSGSTPLQMAAYNLHPDTVKLLIDNNANINTTNKQGKSILIDLVSASSKDREGTSDISIATKIQSDIVQMVKLLLENGADPNIKDSKGRSALMEARKNEYSEIAELLKQSGAGE
jgi:ankyrin repeat protein